MAQYKTHITFNIIIALPILYGATHYFLDPNLKLSFAFIGTYLYSTLFMNPDLDVANKIKLFSLRGLLTLPFRGYALLFKHRGISHSIFLGSLTRIAWLVGLFLLLAYPWLHTGIEKKDLIAFYHQHHLYFYYGLAGICSADWSHLLLDFFT